MSAFQFVSHENYPEDQYVAEAVTLCFDGKYRVTYIRKKMQNGGMFWGEISASVKQHGEKKYLKSFSQDSNFLQEDIKSFLENRLWEKGRARVHQPVASAMPSGGNSEFQNEEVPF